MCEITSHGLRKDDNLLVVIARRLLLGLLGEGVNDLLRLLLELDVSALSHLEGRLDDLLGLEVPGPPPCVLGGLAERSQALGREGGIVRLDLGIAELAQEGLEEVLLHHLVRVVEEGIGDGGGGFGSGLAQPGAVVLQHVEGVGQDGEGEVVQHVVVALLVGRDAAAAASGAGIVVGVDVLLESAVVAQPSELDEGQYGLADAPLIGPVVVVVLGVVLRFVLGGTGQDDAAGDEGRLDAGAGGVGQQAQALHAQLAGVHPILLEKAGGNLEGEEGILVFGGGGGAGTLINGWLLAVVSVDQHILGPLAVLGLAIFEADVGGGVEGAGGGIEEVAAVLVEGDGVAAAALGLDDDAILGMAGGGALP